MKLTPNVAVAAGILLAAGLLAGPPGAPEPRLAPVEADWLRQEAVRERSGRGESVSPEEDAAGGCDGIKDGRWGFHTGRDEGPWWQVDLEREEALSQVLIYNRCDGASERALRLAVKLSRDGRDWTAAYRHDGSLFLGQPDGKPLAVSLGGAVARFVRVELPGSEFLHLDEVEVHAAAAPGENIALGKPATQSSVSPWSARSPARAGEDLFRSAPRARRALERILARGRRLAAALRRLGVEVSEEVRLLEILARGLAAGLPAAPAARRELIFEARRAVRRLAFRNPLLDFDDLLLVKRVPTSFTHMSDQYYGWFSRPGGGLYVLEDWKGPAPRLRCLSSELPPGNIVRPEISYDGRRVLFAHARFRPGLAKKPNKLDKARLPEDAFYHLYEVGLDGTGLRRLTHGKYDDFDGRYLPDGRIVFLSTRRGQFVQLSRQTARSIRAEPELPDCYVRCGGGPERPVAVYTLHVMGPGGEDIRTISPFENFEWTPSVASDGRILYARWDYIDRDNMPYMSLWSCLPDGTGTRAVFGNHTQSPYSFFEARSVPGSRRLIFTASAHHATTGGSLVLLDPSRGTDGPAALERLTPEVPFPEVEAWPETYYANPWPLSEEFYLVAWSDQPLAPGWPRVNPPNGLGIYLYDAFGNLELIHRDPEISTMYPLPVRPRERPPRLASALEAVRGEEGRVLVLDAREGLEEAGEVRVARLRIVGVPAKTQPTMNTPNLGVTRDDPGKFVLGTVPVEEDGSAHFQVPAGLPFFLQALDARGLAVQTMRSVLYVQPGETRACTGCHPSRHEAPASLRVASAARRSPSRIAPGPEGSWPLDFAALVGPVLERRCSGCHRPGAPGATLDLTPEHAYEALVAWGGESLREQVLSDYRRGRSLAGAGGARRSALWRFLEAGHEGVELAPEESERLVTWLDTYGQRQGSFSGEQEARLQELRERLAALLERAAPRGEAPGTPEAP